MPYYMVTLYRTIEWEAIYEADNQEEAEVLMRLEAETHPGQIITSEIYTTKLDPSEVKESEEE